jgi:hypothetical protein
MATFRCNKCQNHIELTSYKVHVDETHGIVCEQAICCDTYMERLYNFQGWGTIRKTPNGGVGGKQIVNAIENLKK